MHTGAHVLLTTLSHLGISVCFTNPGTSEMYCVADFSDEGPIRPILCLFEGVATGAADGYARIAHNPALTLLHLGPGFANGLANLHNGYRARVPIINIIGDHATYHHQYDAPLESPIELLTQWTRGWTRRINSPDTIIRDACDAVKTARGYPPQIANLIVPSDVSWASCEYLIPDRDVDHPHPCLDLSIVNHIEQILTHHDNVGFFIGGQATTDQGLYALNRIHTATGAKILVEMFPTCLAQGIGVPPVERLSYLPEQARAQLSGIQHLILIGTHLPASFFAYPHQNSILTETETKIYPLTHDDSDLVGILQHVADCVSPGTTYHPTPTALPQIPTGPLTIDNWVNVIAALLPDNAIISDESMTSGFLLTQALQNAPRHDLLTLTGGAIGQGLPVALGASIADPSRPVIALEADGSAIYTLSALWTMARQQANIIVIILNNHAYSILRGEYARLGISHHPAGKLFDLTDPCIDFVQLALGFGIPASTATTCEELAEQFQRGLHTPGPYLIDAHLPALFS